MARIKYLDFAKSVEINRQTILNKMRMSGQSYDNKSLASLIESAELVQKDPNAFYFDENYPDIERILNENTDDCIFKEIYLIPNFNKNIILSGDYWKRGDIVYTSDGQKIVGTGSSTTIIFDYFKDIPYPGKHFSTRWFMIIHKSSTMPYISWYNKPNLIAIVIDFNNMQDTSNVRFASFFNNSYDEGVTEYIKIKNLTSNITAPCERIGNWAIDQFIFENCSITSPLFYLYDNNDVFIGKTNNINLILDPSYSAFIKQTGANKIEHLTFDNIRYNGSWTAAISGTYSKIKYLTSNLSSTFLRLENDYSIETHINGLFSLGPLYTNREYINDSSLYNNIRLGTAVYLLEFDSPINNNLIINNKSTGSGHANLSMDSLLYLFKCLVDRVDEESLVLTLSKEYTDFINNYYAKEYNDTLKLCNKDDEGAIKIIDYINNKNWTLSYN